MPCICRLSPKGSRDPVAFSPAMDQTDERVQLVGERHRRPRRRRLAQLRSRRRRIDFDADRQVLVVDRLPHRLGQPLFAGVDAAHRALELGELEDHVARQIGLRQPRRRAPRARRCRDGRRPRWRSTPPASRSARPCRGSSRPSCGRAPCAAARAATRASARGPPPRRTSRRAGARPRRARHSSR